MTAANLAADRTGLAALPTVLDVGVMSQRLAPFWGQEGDLLISSASLLDCSYGKRAVIAYETLGRAGRGPVLIGKVYCDHQRAHRLHQILQELTSLDADGLSCGVPHPIARLDEFGMSVYAAAGGRPLCHLQHQDRLQAIAAAARWLCVLHRSTLDLGRRLDLPAETLNLARWATLVEQHEPRAAPGVARLLDRIVGLGPQADLGPQAPIHKDFHYQHTLFESGRVVVIDLDEMRIGDPTFDVAHFEAYLGLLAFREEMPPGRLSDLRRMFFETYTSRMGSERGQRHDFFHAYTCLKIAKQLVGGRGPAPVPTGVDRWKQLDFILQEGMRCPDR